EEDVKKTEHRSKDPRTLVVPNEVDDCRPHRSEYEENQNPPRVAKRRKMEFGAAVHPGRNDNLRIRWRGHVGGVGLEARRSGCTLCIAQERSRWHCGRGRR